MIFPNPNIWLTSSSVSTGNGQPSITMYDSTLEFKVDDENHMRIIPPTLFVRLRQEMAASRINKLLYSANTYRFSDDAGITYMNLEAARLKEERESVDGVDNGTIKFRLCDMHWLTSAQTWKTSTIAQYHCISTSILSSVPRPGSKGAKILCHYILQLQLT